MTFRKNISYIQLLSIELISSYLTYSEEISTRIINFPKV